MTKSLREMVSNGLKVGDKTVDELLALHGPPKVELEDEPVEQLIDRLDDGDFSNISEVIAALRTIATLTAENERLKERRDELTGYFAEAEIDVATLTAERDRAIEALKSFTQHEDGISYIPDSYL